MSNHLKLTQALAELANNQEQRDAVQERGHCVVYAGPGSGKTKTLTIAMARALIEDIIDPRGVACITYNNECAIELETRLAAFGIVSDERNFIGTLHSFALTQVIIPYARCIPGLVPNNFRVANYAECRQAVENAYAIVINGRHNPHDYWKFAQEKRRRDIDRTLPCWYEKNPELARFIEAYEEQLRYRGLIDFDDMPLIAFKIIKNHSWVKTALLARFPILFVDEYQDLGHALHELVLLLCFNGGIRLFAVGDIDQSIYGFTGANPDLLKSLADRDNVRKIELQFNYRSGKKIIRASLGALGEERNYHGIDSAPEGDIFYYSVKGDLNQQAYVITNQILPDLLKQYTPEEIAILYRNAKLGNKLATELDSQKIPYIRTDGNALIKRSSRLARFIESCAVWVTGGWCNASPRYEQLLIQAKILVYGRRTTVIEEQELSLQLITFLLNSIDSNETTYNWLKRFDIELIKNWQTLSQNPQQEWDIFYEILKKTDPICGKDMSLNIFSGKIEGSGRINLSTLHSSKGREFNAVILYGINNGEMPSNQDNRSSQSLREARRLFYVGVTRPRKELLIVYQNGLLSPWVKELYNRSQQA